jgi:hypothetical protein
MQYSVGERSATCAARSEGLRDSSAVRLGVKHFVWGLHYPCIMTPFNLNVVYWVRYDKGVNTYTEAEERSPMDQLPVDLLLCLLQHIAM